MNKPSSNQNQATPRPGTLVAHGCAIYTVDNWQAGFNHGGQLVATTFIDDTGTAMVSDADIERAELIVTAVNEHEALCAVAEALKEASAWLAIDCAIKTDRPKTHGPSDAYRMAINALSTLEAIRRGKV